METKSRIDDINVWDIKDNAKHFKNEEKDPETPKGMLIYLALDDRHIALRLIKDAHYALKLCDLHTKNGAQCMNIQIAKTTLEECYKEKNSFSSASDGYVIKDVSDILHEDMFKTCQEAEELSVAATCYMESKSSWEKQSPTGHYGRVLQIMENLQVNYLEFKIHKTGSTCEQGLGDVDEDGETGSTTGVSESSAFFGPSHAKRDLKNSPEFLRCINKIRELQKCPVDTPPGYSQGATFVEVEDDGLGDVDEDGESSSTTEVSESSPFFGPSRSMKDPKKSPEFLRSINKIRELQHCPVDIPPGYAQGAPAAEVLHDDDLETDVVFGSSREPEPALFGEEFFKSKSSKQLALPGSQGKNNTNIGNVRYLLATPAASSVLEMDYGDDDVVQAISTYMKHKGNVEFDVNDLITILEDEEPKIQKIEATNT